MMKHYDADTFGESFKNHPVIEGAKEVEDSFAKIGKPVELVEYIKPEKGTVPDKKNLRITPKFSKPTERYVDEVAWLSVREEIKESFGETENSAEITNIFVRHDMSVGEIIKKLDSTDYLPDEEDNDIDMITAMVEGVILTEKCGRQMARKIIAYTILRKSMGWKAEKFLSRTEDFHKATAGMDKDGVDLKPNKSCPFDVKDSYGFQLKTMQRVTSKDLHLKEHKHPHLSYSWTENGIHVSSMEFRSKSMKGYERNQDYQVRWLNARLELDSSTILKQSREVGEMKDYGRSARVIAW